jgi:predicted amidohydrolase
MQENILAARERGVLFDVGHGFGSFSFDVAPNAYWTAFARMRR